MNKNEYYQALTRTYRRETGKAEVSTLELAEWHINNGKFMWEPTREFLVKKCGQEFAEALRLETYIDPQGREVRLNRCVRERKGQLTFAHWGTMKSSAPDFLEKSLQQERMACLARLRKLKTSFDSYKQNINPGTQLEIIYNFTDDLAEMELAMGFASDIA